MKKLKLLGMVALVMLILTSTAPARNVEGETKAPPSSATGRQDLGVATTTGYAFFVDPISGHRYEVLKDFARQTTRYCDTASAQCFDTKADLFEAESHGLPDWYLRVDPALREKVETTQNSGRDDIVIPIIIEVEGRPLSEAASDIWPEISAKIGELPSSGEEAFLDRLGQERGDAADVDVLLDRGRGRIYHLAKTNFAPHGDKTAQSVREFGGEVIGSTPVLPAVYARVPLRSVPLLASMKTVRWISEDQLMDAAMDVSAPAILADVWWDEGYNGGAWDLAVVDTGIDGTHPALTVDNAGVFHTVGQTDSLYDDDPSDPDDFHGHGTHIAGTIASIDSTYRGVAYGMDDLINAKAGWLGTDGGSHMYWSDGMDAIDWAIQTAGADVVSFSFGGSPGTGDTPMARYFDAVVDNLGIVVAIAAHNHGPQGGTVTETGTAYNILSVGNMQDDNTISRYDDTIHPSSGRGPTGDGRRKPDIVAPGTLIASANSRWESESDFVSWTGTSMATPHVAASILLLMHDRGIVFPPIYKALLMNSADDWGSPGPDDTYGWGYLNLSRAYSQRSTVYDGYVADGATRYQLYSGPIAAGQKATLVWNRHAGYLGSDYPTTYYDLNDLDLYAYSETNNSLVVSSTSPINNVEQTVVDTDYPAFVYKVDAFGSFAGVTQEHYALAVVDSIAPVSPPSLTVDMSVPSSVLIGKVFSISATVSNSGGLSIHGVEVVLTLPSGLSLVAGADPQNLGMIRPGSDAVASWQIRGNEIGSQTLSTDSSSQSYGETFSNSSGSHVIDIVSPYTWHERIFIESNDDFTLENGIVGGTGTPSDPYVIEGWEFDFSAGYTAGILIRYTDAHFIIRDVYAHSDGTDTGIRLDSVSNGRVENTVVVDTSIGIYLIYSTSVAIINNDFTSNWYGINVTSSSSVTIAENNISWNSRYGVSLSGSTSALVHRNSFLGNGAQARDDGGSENSWDDGYARGGNYWSDYSGADSCSRPSQGLCPDPDGIGDTPYVIDADSRDRYPLVEPYAPTNTTPHAVFVLTPTVGSLTTAFTANASASWDAADPTSRLEVRWDWQGDGEWDTLLTTAKTADHIYTEPGVHTIVLEVRDPEGLRNQTTKLVTVDGEAPGTTIELSGALGQDGWFISAVTVTLSASDDLAGVSSTSYRVEDGAWQTYDAPFDIHDGIYTLEFFSIDAAGNVESIRREEVRIDTGPPAIQITSPDDGQIVTSSSVVVSWIGDDAVSLIATYEVVIDDNGPINAGNAETVVVDEVSDGRHRVTVIAIDRAGNRASASVVFHVDTDIPGPTVPYSIWLLAVLVLAVIGGIGGLIAKRRRCRME